MATEPDPKALEKLWQDTRIPPPEMVQLVDKGAFKADAVGHADVTDLLLGHDPCFTWEPMAKDEHGNPIITTDTNGNPAMWIWLTVHGITKPGVGTCLKTAKEPVKELVGDAIRNAAMRFGVALTLWSKTERAAQDSARVPHTSAGGESPGAAEPVAPAPAPPPGPATKLEERRQWCFNKARDLPPDALNTLKQAMAEKGIGMDFSAHTEEQVAWLESKLEPF